MKKVILIVVMVLFSATNLSAMTIEASCEWIGNMTNCLLYAHEGIVKARIFT